MDLQQLRIELGRDEGIRTMPYTDSRGFLTVAIGHNCEANPLPAKYTFPLSESDIEEIFNDDEARIEAELFAALPWVKTLDEVRQRVLMNMAFNMGVTELCTFHRTLAAVDAGQYDTAATDMAQSDWYKEVGQRAIRLCKAMSSGVMPV